MVNLRKYEYLVRKAEANGKLGEVRGITMFSGVPVFAGISQDYLGNDFIAPFDPHGILAITPVGNFLYDKNTYPEYSLLLKNRNLVLECGFIYLDYQTKTAFLNAESMISLPISLWTVAIRKGNFPEIENINVAINNKKKSFLIPNVVS